MSIKKAPKKRPGKKKATPKKKQPNRCVCGHAMSSHSDEGCKWDHCDCKAFEKPGEGKNGPQKAYSEGQSDVTGLIHIAKKETRPVGRPPFYEHPAELQDKIDEFVLYCQDQRPKLPLTISGLVYYLGFADRRSFYDQEEREGFSYTIKRARTVIETAYEQNLHFTGATGSIFALKNFGWEDEQTVNHEGAIPATIVKNYEDKDQEEKQSNE